MASARRLLRINRYCEDVDPVQLRRLVGDDGVQRDWIATLEVHMRTLAVAECTDA